MANSADPDQIPNLADSGLGLHCLQGSVRLSKYLNTVYLLQNHWITNGAFSSPKKIELDISCNPSSLVNSRRSTLISIPESPDFLLTSYDNHLICGPLVLPENENVNNILEFSRRQCHICQHLSILLTLVMLNLDMSCLCKQCRSRSVGF